MNLEKTVRFHFPKSSRVSDEPRGTSADTLQMSEVMAAIGMAEANAGFGMSAFFGKMGLSQNDKNRAVTALMKLTRARIGKLKLVAELTGRQRARMIYLMALFAYEDYCRTAATPENRCPSCKGRGIVRDVPKIAETHQRVMKTCSRCKGFGFRRVKGEHLRSAIKQIMPELSQASFYRYLFPVFKELIQVCFEEETRANNALKKVSHQNMY
ncbi:antitermination protein [Pantoea sp. ICBG 1758]|uniref:antitermination protein Q n=1 Tax=Pantoea sp. ICBG 1758 TaxID=2071682 RepID=UPI000CE33820|nr:antitermination protein [Pantoea sp. ICBG 1758]PPC63892.1 antitermination protein [Pantoea sp. ICBG 1758]